jgi:flagellar biosynthesis/type III secretory pathway M-ring protein FliF/YscJ
VTAIPPETTAEKLLRTAQEVQRPALGVFALVMALLVAMMMMKNLKAPSADAVAMALPAAPQDQLPTGAAEPPQLTEGTAEEPAPTFEALQMPVNALKERVIATAEAYPDVSAKILRNWMRSA